MILAGANWRPIGSNYSASTGRVIGVVLHVQEGNGSLFGFFNNPATKASATGWIAKDGTLEQYLDPDTQTGWAQSAGNYAPPQGNGPYASFETEGFVGEALSDAQILTFASVLHQLSLHYGFPLAIVGHGAPGFTSHCNPDGTVDAAWGGHSCPGSIRLGQMPAILAAALPNGPPTEGDNVTSYIDKDGTQHVYAYEGGACIHWWYIPVGNGAGWHVEKLPSP
jgi:hypothetical protein